MDDLQQLIKELGDRVDALNEEIATLKASNLSQDTQLQATNTALEALKVAQQNKRDMRSLTEDIENTNQDVAARMQAMEKVSIAIWRSIRVLLIVGGGYLLLLQSLNLWTTEATNDDDLADWLAKGALFCFAWALIVLSGKEQKAGDLIIDSIKSLPFFRK